MAAPTSKVEFMAQKHNRVAQHRLNDKIVQIEKEFTLSKLTNRIFMKQLKYDIAQVKKCTGHSPLARPPTGEEDTRSVKRTDWRLPAMRQSSGEPIQHNNKSPLTASANPELRATFPAGPSLAVDAETGLPEVTTNNTSASLVVRETSSLSYVPQDNNGLPTNSREQTNLLLAGQDKSDSLSTSNDKEAGEDNSDFFLTQTADDKPVDKLSPSRPESPKLSSLFEGDFFADAYNTNDTQIARKDILARIEETKRIINMPSIYQTAKMKSKRGVHNRVLPPIAVSAIAAHNNSIESAPPAEEKKKKVSETSKPKEITKGNHVASSTVEQPEQESVVSSELEQTADGIRVSFTPKEKAKYLKKEKLGKAPAISEILQASLARAAKQRKEDRRKEQRQKAKTKLAIEAPEGLFRPENMKLIHKTFKKEDLYLEHKELLAQNSNQKHIPVPKLLGINKLQGRLQAFLEKN